MIKKRIYVYGDGLNRDEVFGVQRYTYELLRELDKTVEKDSIVILLTSAPKQRLQFENISVETVQLKNIGSVSQIMWKFFGFRHYAKKHNGIVMELALCLPLLGADIVAIHDCIVEKVKKNNDTLKKKIGRLVYMLRAYINLKRSKIVITVSEHARNDISDYYRIPKSKIKVIYNSWQHFARIKEDESILDQYGLKKGKFCFSLGSLYYHKNFKWVIEAAKQNPQYTFVVAGSNLLSNINSKFSKEKVDNLIFSGYISDEQVKALMKNCKVFIQPSLYEGFGLPPLEAMSTGARCIVSNATSLPEIYRDSVWYIDPHKYTGIDIDAIMSKEIEDNEKVLNRFSWKKSAYKLKMIIDYVQDHS
ncbi:MAG: glycosyltransferase family 4 protein [Lachnospiraceae bacterium]|nr:glycosyltransferase family 4 protein [Lachnospiraceae bacterium]